MLHPHPPPPPSSSSSSSIPPPTNHPPPSSRQVIHQLADFTHPHARTLFYFLFFYPLKQTGWRCTWHIGGGREFPLFSSSCSRLFCFFYLSLPLLPFFSLSVVLSPPVSTPPCSYHLLSSLPVLVTFTIIVRKCHGTFLLHKNGGSRLDLPIGGELGAPAHI